MGCKADGSVYIRGRRDWYSYNFGRGVYPSAAGQPMTCPSVTCHSMTKNWRRTTRDANGNGVGDNRGISRLCELELDLHCEMVA
eukprot:1927858-Amphidinium_carterae.1